MLFPEFCDPNTDIVKLDCGTSPSKLNAFRHVHPFALFAHELQHRYQILVISTEVGDPAGKAEAGLLAAAIRRRTGISKNNVPLSELKQPLKIFKRAYPRGFRLLKLVNSTRARRMTCWRRASSKPHFDREDIRARRSGIIIIGGMNEGLQKKFQEEIRRPLEQQGYIIQRTLGKGAFGEVFQAVQSIPVLM